MATSAEPVGSTSERQEAGMFIATRRQTMRTAWHDLSRSWTFLGALVTGRPHRALCPVPVETTSDTRRDTRRPNR